MQTRITETIWFNAIWFQSLWFCTVLGRESLLPLAIVLLAVHLWLCGDLRRELKQLLLVGGIGIVADATIHNRWHPDIPIVEWVEPGADFIVEAYDWTGSQIANNDDAADVRDVELPQVHYLSGPIGVK
ncbi:MAG: DUF2878 family protein, partial [Pseudomonadota bacterium]